MNVIRKGKFFGTLLSNPSILSKGNVFCVFMRYDCGIFLVIGIKSRTVFGRAVKRSDAKKKTEELQSGKLGNSTTIVTGKDSEDDLISVDYSWSTEELPERYLLTCSGGGGGVQYGVHRAERLNYTSYIILNIQS